MRTQDGSGKPRLLLAMALASGITSVPMSRPNMGDPFSGLAPRP
jgi:hypothetical protein